MADQRVVILGISCPIAALLLCAIRLTGLIPIPWVITLYPIWVPLAIVGLWIVGTGLLTALAGAITKILEDRE